jgi:hypothetical protein
MTDVVDIFRSILPARSKSSPSGWTSFNAPCCHHRGHKPDTRKRAGVRFDQGIVYNCFNCKFTTGWQPGSPFGEKMKTLCRWLGASDDSIKEMIFEALKTESGDYQPQQIFSTEFTEKDLPEAAMPISKWLEEYNDNTAEFLDPVIEYIAGRGFDPLSENFYWSPAAGYSDRVILPYYYHGRIVGSTARKITNGKPKYISDQHPHFVYNVDQQNEHRKYLLVTEAQFDALSVDGVALLTNDISEQQSRIINNIGKDVIIVPDQDIAGLNIIDRAVELGWSVAFPNWDNEIKDCADAVQKYGKLFVIVDVIETAEKNPIKIEMAKRTLMQKIKNGERNV